MDRKKFILLSGLGISAFAIPGKLLNFQKVESDPLLAEPELLSHIWDGSTIRTIGEAYRNQFPEENSESVLEDLLSHHASTESSTTIENLQKQISSDFIQGNTLMIDGWFLSRTELRQCALFSFT